MQLTSGIILFNICQLILYKTPFEFRLFLGVINNFQKKKRIFFKKEKFALEGI